MMFWLGMSKGLAGPPRIKASLCYFSHLRWDTQLARFWIKTALRAGLKFGLRLWLLWGSLTIASFSLPFPALAASAADYRLQGLAYRQAGNFPAAIAAFESAAALEPDNLEGRILLGWTQHLAGQRLEATTTLQQVVWTDPELVPALNALGIVYLVSGELAPAFITHGWALMLKPDNEIAVYNLSLTCQRLGFYDWAVLAAERATVLEPGNPHPFIALALAHWSQGNPTQAKAVYQQALALDGRYGDRGFIQYLAEAGFSTEQIQTVATILQN